MKYQNYSRQSVSRKPKRSHRRLYTSLFCLLLIALVGSYSVWAAYRPLPALQPTTDTTQLSFATQKGTFTWPPDVQAAVAIPGSTIIETQGDQRPVPMASTAKIITALMALKKLPLKPGETGPTRTLTAADVAIYSQYVAQDGSVTPVQAGEQITEYQMLQAIMLPSANNLADSMAIWGYGSLPEYAIAANKYTAELGLKDTHIGSDASGLAPDTVSSARDLVKLGSLAMEHPVLASIAGQSIATGIPNAGTIRNVNVLLGESGIVGIKTGNSDQAGGVFVSASRITFNKKPLTIVTAMAGAPDLSSALRTSLALVKSAQANFATTNILSAGSVVGRYRVPWGADLTVTTDSDLIVTSWRGETIKANVALRPLNITTAHKNQTVGSVSTKAGDLETSDSVLLKLNGTAPEPNVWWRLSHPLR